MDLRTVLEIELLNVETKGEGKTKENCIIQFKGSISWSTRLVHNFCDMLLAQTSTRGTQSYSW